MLRGFYDWASSVYWGNQPVTLVDELVWLVFATVIAAVIMYVSIRWLKPWMWPLAVIVAGATGVIVVMTPTMHANKFVQCETRLQTIVIDTQERVARLKYCRTRDTLDSNWNEWQWRTGTVE